MDGDHEELERTGDDSSWSLLYAPPTSLQPIACHACGNVFAAESTACPWCGRMVASSTRRDDTEEVELGSSASLLIPQRAADAGADASRTTAASDGATEQPANDTTAGGAPVEWLEPTAGQQARRWAGVLVAAGVLLAIATGVTVRSREADDGTTAAAPATTRVTVAGPTSASPATTAAPTTVTPTATTAPSTSAATTTATTTTATTTAATTATIGTAAPTTAPRPTPTTSATTAAATTTTEAGPSLSGPERDALAVTRALNDAIVRRDWDTVRTLTPANPATDDTYERFWGRVEAATVVPARVAARPGGTFDVFVGVVSVTRADGGLATSLVCGKYTIDGGTDTVTAVATRPLRTQPGTVDSAAVATELRDACVDPGL